MAIYHLSVKTGSPGKGGPHAEYVLRQGEYADRQDFVASESGNMPAWAAHDPTVFWAAADAYERANGRTYTELEIALPRELTRDQQVALAREFTENTLGQRHAFTWAIHAPQASDQEAQPHLHLMFSERRVDGIERDPDEYFRRWNPKNPERGGAGKDRYFSSMGFVWAVREEWARTANEALERAGQEARIDHRSYRDSGVQLEPSRKLGIAKHGEQRQVLAAVTAENRERAARNGDLLSAAPEKAIEALTAHQSVFSKRELDNLIFRNSDSAEQFQTLKLKVFNSPELVALNKVKGEPEFFTSRTLYEAEKALVSTAGRLAKAVPANGVRTHIRDGVAAGRSFNEGQAKAFEVLTGPTQLASVSGAAGSGKSFVLSAVRETYERSGMAVIGAALQGKTADDLERDSGIRSSTLHSLLFRIERGDAALDAKTVVVIDEAGLVGSAQFGQLLQHVERSKATVRVVGDSYQLSAVAAGDAFRRVSDQAAAAGVRASLTEIVRQREGWQREASAALSEHRIAEGLQAYRDRGFITEYGTQAEARAGLLAQWDADRKARPEDTQILVVHTNLERQALNKSVREIRRAAGELGQEHVVEGAGGRLDLALGDRLIFLQNDTQLGVKNGTTGTLEGLRGSRLAIRTDRGAKVEVDAKEYGHIDHGYAITVHKSQGVTVDKAYALATDTLDAQLTYVGLTRHRDGVQLAFSREHFRGYDDLVDRLSRVREKSFSADFAELNFDRAAEKGERETLAERRERSLPKEPALPPESQFEALRAKLWSSSMSDLEKHIRELKQRPEMWPIDQYGSVTKAVSERTSIEASIQSSDHYRQRLLDQKAEYVSANRVNAIAHAVGIAVPELAELDKAIWEKERAIKNAAPELEKARTAEAGVRVEAEKTYAALAPQRTNAERHIRFAEAILERRKADPTAEKGLDSLSESRLKGDPGFRDADPYWKAFSVPEQQMIERAARGLSERQVQVAEQARERSNEVAQRGAGRSGDQGAGL
ncbi:Ti-type conjugative transfer relaxase TraA [Nevskia ramosa]|uniref:Ti-type conjugative transfer relaxase TraA n=1 Tax=Nevskia ramosa TaxID=64002 RepID=UPI0023528AFE|nr:Ti-type conjugative transfer relaxase TraA [Nevskia ramosa]